MPAVKLAPSILAADFNRLGEQVGEAIKAGAAHIHVDVMDGHFVPNISVGVPIVAALRRIVPPEVLLDVHLMIEPPEPMLAAFVEAGADALTVHVEATPDLPGALRQIRELGARPGVVLKPGTPLSALEDALHLADLFLVMSVEPGFGGQAYIPASTRRVADLRRMLNEVSPGADISVDGGVEPDNAREIVGAGATVLVAGTAIFNARGSVSGNMAALRRAVEPLE
jgi:ribulose-phosphate 3-epimerase